MVRSGKKGGSSSQSPSRVSLQPAGESQATGEFLTALASVQNLQSTLTKKIRNIEKRKRTVQENIEKQARGEELNKEQKESITRLAEVEGNQVFAMDLQKLVSTTLTEVEAADVRSRANIETTRTISQREAATAVIRTFVTLGAIGKSAKLREEHSAGRYGTDCQLSASQFEQLVALHSLLLSTLTSTDNSKASVDNATAHLIHLIETPAPSPAPSPSIVQPQPAESAPIASEAGGAKEQKEKVEGEKKKKGGKKASGGEKASEKALERRNSNAVTLGGQEVPYADLRELLTRLSGSHYFAPLFGLRPTSDPVKPPEKPEKAEKPKAAAASASNANASASAANAPPVPVGSQSSTTNAAAPAQVKRESRTTSRTTSKSYESEVTVGMWTPPAPADTQTTHTNGDNGVKPPVDPLTTASHVAAPIDPKASFDFTFQQQSRASLHAKEFVPAAGPAKQSSVIATSGTPYPLVGVSAADIGNMNWPLNAPDATVPQQQAFLPVLPKQAQQLPVGSGADIAPSWQPNPMASFSAPLSSDPAVVPTSFPPTSQFAPAFSAAPVMSAWNDDRSNLADPLNLSSAVVPMPQSQSAEFVSSVGGDQQALPQQVPGAFGDQPAQQQQQYQQQPFYRGRGRGGPSRGAPRRSDFQPGQRGGQGGSFGGYNRGGQGGGRPQFRQGRGAGGPPRGDFDQHDGPPPQQQQQQQQPQGVWGGNNSNSNSGGGGGNFRARARGNWGPRMPLAGGVQQHEPATGFAPPGPPAPPVLPETSWD